MKRFAASSMTCPSSINRCPDCWRLCWHSDRFSLFWAGWLLRMIISMTCRIPWDILWPHDTLQRPHVMSYHDSRVRSGGLCFSGPGLSCDDVGPWGARLCTTCRYPSWRIFKEGNRCVQIFKSSNSFASTIVFLYFFICMEEICKKHNLTDRRFFVVRAFADLDAIWLFCYASLQLAFWGRREGPTPWRAGTGHPGPVRGAANCQHRCHIFDLGSNLQRHSRATHGD